MKTNLNKWIATKGVRHQATVGFGFSTKREAQQFASRENKRFNSGYYVTLTASTPNPKFI